ncbi:MAG: hypothetical protein MZV64_44095 [Ignavibacteriales bacterium]|nr:hypothetical protein [Ignavibacteriales bacterium]
MRAGVAFDVGVVYDNLAEINGLSFGVVMKNVGHEYANMMDQATSSASMMLLDFNRPPDWFYKIDCCTYSSCPQLSSLV